MLRPLTLVLLSTALAASPGAAPSTYDEVAAGFDFVTVGDPGNAGLSLSNYQEFPENIGRGAVDYSFRVTRTEVTTEQYMEFVNTFSTISDDVRRQLTFGLRWSATVDADYFGPGERYVLTDLRPTTVQGDFVQAAMYINWLHHGKTTDFEMIMDGVYDISTFEEIRLPDNTPVRTDQIERKPGSRFFIPNFDEMLKAGYYDPEKDADGDGVAEGGWWTFPNRSDVAPVSGLPGEGETSRGLDELELEDALGVPGLGSIPVGLYPETASYYGVVDISGTGREFTESVFVSPFSPERSKNRQTVGSSSAFSEELGILNERADTGGFTRPVSTLTFRVATQIPGPPVGVVCMLGGAAIALVSRRRS